MNRYDKQADFNKRKNKIYNEIELFFKECWLKINDPGTYPHSIHEIGLFQDNIDQENLIPILQDSDFSKNDRFIFFSKIAKYLCPSDWNINLRLKYVAEIATYLDVVYDIRTGNKPGCIYFPSYRGGDAEYGCAPCYYFGGSQNNEQPCLDCSGFISWLLYILDIYDGPANELQETKPGSKIYIKRKQSNPGGGGQWNIYSKSFNVPVKNGIPQPGDLIYFPDHIGLVSLVEDKKVIEIIHSAPAHHGQPSGPRIERESAWFFGLMDESKKAVVRVNDEMEVSLTAPYLLTRIKVKNDREDKT